jgi:hypothetical protein
MTSKAKVHPDNETLERYSLGHLAAGELECVEEHLFVCAICQDELTVVDSLARDLKEALAVMRTQPEPKRIRFLDRLFAIPRPIFVGALAALLLVLVVPLTRFRSPNGTPAEVRLQTYRGGEPAGISQADARRPLQLKLADPRGLATGNYQVEIVNDKGSKVWSGRSVRDNAGLFIDAQAFVPGKYWIRLFGAGNALAAEYGLELK